MTAGETIALTPTESLTVRRADADMLEVLARYGPASRKPPTHLHPDQDEHFEIVTGTMRVRLDGNERTLTAGDTLDVPRGTKHQMWNPGPDPAEVVWQTLPAGRTLEWWRALSQAGGARGRQPNPLRVLPLLWRYRDVFRLAR